MTNDALLEYQGQDELPDSWVSVPIEGLFDVHYGKGLAKAKRDESGKIPVYGSNGITGWHTESLTDCATIIVGRKGSAGEVELSPVPCWVIDTAYFIEDPKYLEIKYIYYVLKTIGLVQLDTSTAIPSLRRDDIYASYIPLAPLNEQRRIVEEIEAQFTRLDAGIAALKRLEANLKRYKASVLKAACEGNLVPQDPNDEPASELLERILVERRQRWEETYKYDRYTSKGKKPPKGWKDRYPEPVEPDTDDLPELPEGWVWANIEQISSHVTSGSRGWAKYYVDSGELFLRVGNLDRDTLNIDLSETVFVDAPDSAEAKRTQLQIHDLLVSVTADVGMVGLVDSEVLQWGRAFVNQHVAIVRPVETEIAEYIGLIIASDPIQSQFKELQYGATKSGLRLDQLQSIIVPIAPINEQYRIIDELEKVLSICYEFELAVQHNIKRAERLRQSILKEAFAGRLVPQDPSDEPASELLQRIQAERRK